MTSSDSNRWEVERLRAMGRIDDEPTPLQALIARAIDPSAWSAAAEEQIAWCMRHGLMRSPSHFGSMVMDSRLIAYAKAADVLRAKARADAGLPELRPFNASDVSDRLAKAEFQIHRASRPGQYVDHRPARDVFLLKSANGIAGPGGEEVAPDGAVALVWSEEDRIVRLSIGRDRVVTIAVGDDEPEAVDFGPFRPDGPLALARAVDWVHHGAPRPGRIGAEARTAA